MYSYSKNSTQQSSAEKSKQQNGGAASSAASAAITDNQAQAAMWRYYDDSRRSARQVDVGEALRAKMSASFGDASRDVKIYSNSRIADIGEKGFAKGNEVHIAPSVLSDSHSLEGILSHEMTHIAQQSAGRANGSGILMDSAQEAQANSGAGMAIGTLANADNAPIQGNMATALWRSFKNKVKTMANINGYADDKSRARRDVARNLETKGEPFESHRGIANMLSFHTGLTAEDKALREQRGSVYSEHYDKAAKEHLLPKSDAYLDAVFSMKDCFSDYNEGSYAALGETDDDKIERANKRFKAVSLMKAKMDYLNSLNRVNEDDKDISDLGTKIDTAKDAEINKVKFLPGYAEKLQQIASKVAAVKKAKSKNVGKHNKRLDDLKKAELELYEFQKKYDAAAYDEDFVSLNNEISALFSELYNMTSDNGWGFHRAGSNDAESDTRANELWNSVRNGNGSLSINDKRFVNQNEETAVGFREATLGNLGRIMSTQTGLDLVDALVNGNENHTYIRPVNKSVKENGTVSYSSPGAVGWDSANNIGLSTEISQQNYLRRVTNEKESNAMQFEKGAGTDSLARYNHETADSQVYSLGEDGTTVISPQYVLLAHEMMHALHNNKGINSRHRGMYEGQKAKGDFEDRWSTPEELATMYGTNQTNEKKNQDASDMNLSGYEKEAQDRMRKYVGSINEQKMRDELNIRGRYGHNVPKSTKVINQVEKNNNQIKKRQGNRNKTS